MNTNPETTPPPPSSTLPPIPRPLTKPNYPPSSQSETIIPVLPNTIIKKSDIWDGIRICLFFFHQNPNSNPDSIKEPEKTGKMLERQVIWRITDEVPYLHTVVPDGVDGIVIRYVELGLNFMVGTGRR